MRTPPHISSMKQAIVWVILVTMPAHSVPAYASPSSQAGTRLTDDPRVRTALDFFKKNLPAINETQIRLTEIPAPSFQEAVRANAVKLLFEQAGLHTQIDSVG